MTGSSQAKQAILISRGGHHAETLLSVDHAEYQASHQAQLARPLLGHELVSQASFLNYWQPKGTSRAHFSILSGPIGSILCIMKVKGLSLHCRQTGDPSLPAAVQSCRTGRAKPPLYGKVCMTLHVCEEPYYRPTAAPSISVTEPQTLCTMSGKIYEVQNGIFVVLKHLS